VQDLVDRGQLSAADAVRHPASHVLYRAVGVEPVLQLDAIADKAEPRDVFLLCSDGLTGIVSDDEISHHLGALSPQAAAQELLTLALARGAPDNVSVIIVSCEEKTNFNLGSGVA
jgi:serine/threonine-protein phosphatase Stp1